MVSQILKTLSKSQVLQLKTPRLCLKPLMVGLCVLSASIWLVLTTTCPSSVPSSAGKIADQCSYTGYTDIRTFGVARGPVSNSLFYLDQILSPTAAWVLRKVDASDSQAWITSFAFNIVMKSLSVDAAEQTVYFVGWISPTTVLRLDANDGSILNQHQL